MRVEEIETLGDANQFVEGVINDFESGIATKAETMGHLGKYTARLMELFWQNAVKKIKENPELLTNN